MVQLITYNVKNDRFTQRVALTPDEAAPKPKGKTAKSAAKTTPAADGDAPKEKKKRAPRKKAEPAPTPKYTLATLPTVCPQCGRGHLLRGRTAYGCSEYASGCTFRIPLTDVAEE
jgi:DNA topoisomerase-3